VTNLQIPVWDQNQVLSFEKYRATN
jgi:hypothetical protein